MRPLFKNDIIRVAKDFNTIRCWGVYFLIYNDTVIYVGYSAQPLSRLFSHKNRFEIHKYHVLYFKTQEEAIQMEKEYIRTFKPIYNISENDESLTLMERKKIKQSEELNRLEKIKIAASKVDSSKNKREYAKAVKLAEKIAISEAYLSAKIDKMSRKESINKLSIDAFKSDVKINMQNDSYIKKSNVYYLKHSGEIFEIRTKEYCFYLKGFKYKYPTKLFGNIEELKIPQD